MGNGPKPTDLERSKKKLRLLKLKLDYLKLRQIIVKSKQTKEVEPETAQELTKH